jgi:pyrophosphatase PpaX
VRYPTILFDFDGTLVDSIELILASYRHTLRVHRGESPPDSVWLAGLGTPLRVQFRIWTDDPAEIESMIATYREWNYAHHDDMVSPYPLAVETVRTLKDSGARLGIVSSKNKRGIERGITLCGFDGLFETLVTADTLEASKPDPAPVLMALAQLKAEPADALFVGDSPHDIAAGRDAGTKTAACLWGPFSRERLEEERPDFWLDSFGDLVQVAR